MERDQGRRSQVLMGREQGYDHRLPRQEYGCLGKEYGSLEKKHELLGQCQHSTNGWNWSLGKGPSPMEGWAGPLEEGTGPLERGTRISWRVKTFTEENTILLARNQRWCTCVLKMISAFLS